MSKVTVTYRIADVSQRVTIHLTPKRDDDLPHNEAQQVLDALDYVRAQLRLLYLGEDWLQ